PAEVRAIFFDAVGTLIHPDPPAPLVYTATARRHGSVLTPEVIGQRFRVAFQREELEDRESGWRTSEERERKRWRRVVGTVLDDVSDPEGCFQELFAHFSRPTAWLCAPDVAPTLEELARRGYRLGLASNYDHRLRSVLAGRPELRLLRECVISSEVGWRKPAAPFFAEVVQRTGLLPEAVLFVGDDVENDYQGARAAGLHALLVDPKGR